MKAFSLIPLAACASTFVISEEASEHISIESHRDAEDVTKVPAAKAFASRIHHNALDIFESAQDAVRAQMTIASEQFSKGQKTLRDQELEEAVKHGLDWHSPMKGPPKKTVYEIIAECKYTTKLASLINEREDLVQLLNGTSRSFTVFAPVDKAFKFKQHKEPSKEIIKDLLSYHVSGDFYPAGRVLAGATVPTLLRGTGLSKTPDRDTQRISHQLGLRGLTVNFYSRIIAIDIFGSNGVIHGLSSVLFPPISGTEIISLIPATFSTLELGLVKTGLFDLMNSTTNHLGGTVFAPNNFAWKLLPFKVNAFLFSKCGEKYLKALLSYHIVANQTLYTDAFYTSEEEQAAASIPKGKFHIDLPTLLGRNLSIDVARFGGLIDFRINSFSSLAQSNLVARDGVLHEISSVLIPPKKVGGELQAWAGEEIAVEDLKERLEPFVDVKDNEDDGDWEL